MQAIIDKVTESESKVRHVRGLKAEHVRDIGVVRAQQHTFVLNDLPMDCQRISPDAVHENVLRYVKQRYCSNRAIEHNVVESREDVRFEPFKTLVPKKYTAAWTSQQAAIARSSVVNGTCTHCRIFAFGWTNDDKYQNVVKWARSLIIYMSASAGGI